MATGRRNSFCLKLIVFLGKRDDFYDKLECTFKLSKYKIMAEIQFTRGMTEESVPNIKLTRSRDGSSGTATFYFDSPAILSGDNREDITGMYMIDEEGEIITREVKGKFVNGKPTALEAIHIMKTLEEWDRFMRFMERYAKQQGLEFSKS
jgi:photosystem II 13kDa protein